MAYLTRTDPTRNLDRFYNAAVTPTLFGEWAVLREWGRRGSPGTLRFETADAGKMCNSPSSARSSAGCSGVTLRRP